MNSIFGFMKNNLNYNGYFQYYKIILKNQLKMWIRVSIVNISS